MQAHSNYSTRKKKLKIQIEGTYEQYYSLSIVNTTTAKALQTYTDTDVKLDPTPYHQAYMQEQTLPKEIQRLANKEWQNPDVVLRNIYPPKTQHMNARVKIIGPYGWEESKIPHQYIEWFNKDLTAIFALSNYVKELLIQNGLTIPVHVTGIACDPLLDVTPKTLGYPLPKGFVLLHVSSCFTRKGTVELLDLFDYHIKQDTKDIAFIIKTFPNPHNTIQEQLKVRDYTRVKEYEAGVSLYEKQGKELLLINQNITQAQLVTLYKSVNILIAPSYAEGFGLPLAEAMLFHLPVVTTGYSGQLDFCTEETAWLADYTLQQTTSHLGTKNSFWAIPKVTSLIAKTEQIYNATPQQIAVKTNKARDFILQNYSAKTFAKRVQCMLKDIV